ncbi:MAG TPA: hypothetical protein VK453_20105 [Micromonosporaceae bacterium]|nr:hypothetical protein [Micromonosporaceae bacterium]
MTTTSAGRSPALPGGARPRASIAAKTLRTDRWWVPPLAMGAVIVFFIAYATVRIFMNRYYWVNDFGYLTPIYSPCVSESCVPGSAHFGTFLPKMPVFIPIAALTLAAVGGFRVTCYYYRKAGYRSLWASPQACAVTEPHKKYTGETRFPLFIMNYHRFFFYAASALLLVNTYDAVHAFGGRDGGFGVGLGTLIIWINVAMLGGYTLSCHACRHVVGGRLKHFSKHPVRYKLWTLISKLNARHGTFAMASLVTVILTDAYIMSVSAEWISDLRFFN